MITDVNPVHSVGVFAQITSVFAALGGEGKEGEGLTAVLYVYQRVKITDLVKAELHYLSALGNLTALPANSHQHPHHSFLSRNEWPSYTHGISIVNISNLKNRPAQPFIPRPNI